MKKVITVCLSLILALSALIVACAEDFTLHAGTMFGDTMEQVQEKETLKYIGEFEYEDVNGTKTTAILYTGTVAGYENCNIWYHFDKTNSTLCDVTYSMGISDIIGEDALLNRLGELGTLLMNKYGEPLSDNDDAKYLIKGRNLNNKNSKYDYDFIGWSVPCDNYNVKIELVINYSSGSPAFLYIDYHPYTNEELEEAKKLKNDTNTDIGDIGTHSADDL